MSTAFSVLLVIETSYRLARNVATEYYSTEYVRVFPIGHK